MTLEEIRGMLEKATPGPWSAVLLNDYTDATYIEMPDERFSDECDMGFASACMEPVYDSPEWAPFQTAIHDNATLIAAAPEIAALLVRAVEAMQAATGPHENGVRGCPACQGEEDIRTLLRELGVEV